MFVYWRLEFPVLEELVVKTLPPKISTPYESLSPLCHAKSPTHPSSPKFFMTQALGTIWNMTHIKNIVSSSWIHYHSLSPVLGFCSRSYTHNWGSFFNCLELKFFLSESINGLLLFVLNCFEIIRNHLNYK